MYLIRSNCNLLQITKSRITELRHVHVKFEHLKRQLKTLLFRDHGALLLVDMSAFKNF